MPATTANISKRPKKNPVLAILSDDGSMHIVGEIESINPPKGVSPVQDSLSEMEDLVLGNSAISTGISKRVFSEMANYSGNSWTNISSGVGGGAGGSGYVASSAYATVSGGSASKTPGLSDKEIDDLQIKIRSAFEYAKSLSERGLHDEGIAMANVAEELQRLIPNCSRYPRGDELPRYAVESITLSAASPTTGTFSLGTQPTQMPGKVGMEFEIIFTGQNIPGFNQPGIRCRLISVDVVAGP